MLNMVLLFIGTTEIIVIGGIALFIFGGKKLPELMRGLGKGVKEFKDGMKDVKEEINSDGQPQEPQEQPLPKEQKKEDTPQEPKNE